MTTTQQLRPLTRLEQQAIEPQQLAKVLEAACRRLDQYRDRDNQYCTAGDVIRTLSLTANRLKRA